MTCQRFAHQMHDYLQKRLARADHVRFEQHVHTCPACRARLAAETRLDAALDAWGTPEPPVNLAATIKAKARSQAQPTPSWRAQLGALLRGHQGWTWAGAAVGVMALSLPAGLWLGGHGSARELTLAQEAAFFQEYEVLKHYELLENWEGFQAWQKQQKEPS